ncbi:hypothetical protein ACIQ6R_18070 [Streptomyces sp. NPDC096048]|uniref:hypothetical protein n=1 Tax=Streptomyces sp. NPDC096048 TaxID=3366072 RepID=UPI0037F9745F
MASTHLTPAERTARNARIRQLATDGASARTIARQEGIHHTTVVRILRTTPEQTERTTPATSGAAPAPRLLQPLDPRTVQDLNCLMDPRTGALPEPIRRIIRAAADARRTSMRTTAHHLTTEDAPPTTGRAPVRAQVAP